MWFSEGILGALRVVTERGCANLCCRLVRGVLIFGDADCTI